MIVFKRLLATTRFIMAALPASAALCACARTVEQSPTPYEARVVVTNRVLNTVRPELFGDNIEWANNGMGIWQPGQGTPDPEIVRELKDLGVTHLRYPGGTLSDYFDWSKAVLTSRTPQPNPFEKGRTQMPAFGPDELATLCRTLNIPAMITVNAGTGTPEMAGSWARWCYETGLRVTAFEVGNEVYMVDPKKPDVPALPIAKTPEEYADFFLRSAEQIRKGDPGVPVGVIGLVDTGAFPLNHYANWLERVLKRVGDRTDFVAIHNGYATAMRASGFGPAARRLPNDDYAATLMAAPVYVRDNLKATKALLARLAPRASIHVTEFGPLVYPIDPAHAREDAAWNTSLAGALYLAGLYNVLLADPRVTSANHLPLCQDVFGALIGIRPAAPKRRTWRNATGHVFRLYSHLAGRNALATETTAPTSSTQQAGIVPALKDVPSLDSAAYATKDGRRLTLILINRDLKRAARVKVAGIRSGLRLRSASLLSASSYLDSNDPDHPERVTPKHTSNADTVPPHSFLSLEFTQ